MEMMVRIKTITDDNDPTRAGHDLPVAQRVRLPAAIYFDFWKAREEDIVTARDRLHARKARENAKGGEPGNTSRKAFTNRDDIAADETQGQNPTSTQDEMILEATQLLTEIAAPGLSRKLNTDHFPVLRVWYDLATHIDANAIPDPLVFANQYDVVNR